MFRGTEPRMRTVLSRLALMTMAAFAVVVTGCERETPTQPAPALSTFQAEEALVLRVAINDTLGAVGGVVFSDMNQNGVLDEGEEGLEGLTVTIADASNMTYNAVTDEAGSYLFDDLQPGFYIVTAPVVEGWTQTTPANVQVAVVAAEMAMIDHGL